VRSSRTHRRPDLVVEREPVVPTGWDARQLPGPRADVVPTFEEANSFFAYGCDLTGRIHAHQVDVVWRRLVDDSEAGVTGPVRGRVRKVVQSEWHSQPPQGANIAPHCRAPPTLVPEKTPNVDSLETRGRSTLTGPVPGIRVLEPSKRLVDPRRRVHACRLRRSNKRDSVLRPFAPSAGARP
jgi:hypothetical protein